jgi:hypothetical protein
MTKAENIVTSIRVEIEAPASVVWKVLTDLDRYAEWNTFCPGISSTLKIGDPVIMKVKTPNSDQIGTALEYLGSSPDAAEQGCGAARPVCRGAWARAQLVRHHRRVFGTQRGSVDEEHRYVGKSGLRRRRTWTQEAGRSDLRAAKALSLTDQQRCRLSARSHSLLR